MKAIHKKHIRHLYKVTCRDVYYLVNGKFKKRFGSKIVTNKHLFLTNNQLFYLMEIKCKGKAILGYLFYDNEINKYKFIDIATYYEEYICINNCIKKPVIPSRGY